VQWLLASQDNLRGLSEMMQRDMKDNVTRIVRRGSKASRQADLIVMERIN